MKYQIIIFTILSLALLNSCSYQPEPIDYGKDICSHCSMAIVEKPFGTELITKQGKIEKFDSIECLAAYILKDTIGKDKIHSMWVTDYHNNQEFIGAEKAVYLHTKNIRSPMGMFLSAFKSDKAAKETLGNNDGDVLTWDEVKELVYREWISL